MSSWWISGSSQLIPTNEILLPANVLTGPVNCLDTPANDQLRANGHFQYYNHLSWNFAKKKNKKKKKI